MGTGFTIVAIQPCYSLYITTEYVGVLHLTRSMSHLIHSIGALLGFSAMIIWIKFFFTKSNKPKHRQTKQKRIRNYIYVTASLISTIFLTVSLLERFQNFPTDIPIVLIAEFIVLTFCGISILIKGNLFLTDK